MSKDFIQNERTKEFIESVKTLVDSGIEYSYKDIADKLAWHPNAMSLVINGYRNVPKDIERKFYELYKSPTSLHNHTNTLQQTTTLPQRDYKDEYIELLREQLKEKERRLQALEDKITTYLNSNKLEAYLQTLHALANTQLDSLLEHRAASEKKDLKKLRTAADTVFDEYQHQILSTGK